MSALVRIHVDAIDTGDSLGDLNPNELRALGERIIHFYRFDTRNLVERQIASWPLAGEAGERGGEAAGKLDLQVEAGGSDQPLESGVAGLLAPVLHPSDLGLRGVLAACKVSLAELRACMGGALA